MFWLKNLHGCALPCSLAEINADRFSIVLVTFGWCQSLVALFQKDCETSRHEVTKHVVFKLTLMTYEKTLNLVYQTNDSSTNRYY